MERSIQILKFGGASVKDADGFRNVAGIVEGYAGVPLAVVVSATGKSTNALELLVNAHYQQREKRYEIFTRIVHDHMAIVAGLFPEGHPAYDEVNDAFVEIEWVLEEEPHPQFDYTYDQIVPVGELVSSIILAHVLREKGQPVEWCDARGIIRTDDTYRDAKVQWGETEGAIRQKVQPLVEAGTQVVTQGFIGATSDNQSTTLGREGSDYTAAILAYCLNAASMSISRMCRGF
jgi:aspartate kinase